MASITLDADDLERLADLVADRVLARIELVETTAEHWMTSAEAAGYLGLTIYALDKHCAARTIPFEQDSPGGKRWFKAGDLDEWRRRGAQP